MTNSRAAKANPFKTIVKLTTETVNNSSTLINDAVLKVSLGASTHYYIIITLFVISNSTPAIKMDFTIPSGATGVRGNAALALSATASAPWTTEVTYATDGTTQISVFTGHILTTGAGTLQLQWAQNTANASNTQILAGSSMIVYKND